MESNAWFKGQSDQFNRPNGIVRVIDNYGNLTECKIKNGLPEGLSRTIFSDGESCIGTFKNKVLDDKIDLN